MKAINKGISASFLLLLFFFNYVATRIAGVLI